MDDGHAHRNRGFVFTMDALFALAALVLLSVSFAGLASTKPEMQRYSALDTEGRDYLQMVYQKGYNLTNDDFRNLTGHTLYGGLGTLTWDFPAQWQIDSDWSGTPSGEWIWGNLLGVPVYIHNAGTDPAYSFNKNGSWSDYEVSTKVQFSSAGSSNPLAGVSARVNATGGRYACVLYGNSKLVLMKLNSSSDSLSGYTGNRKETATSFNTNANTWYVVSLKVIGNALNCSAYLPGGAAQNSILSSDDINPIISGGIGLEATSTGGTAYFDFVTVKYVPTTLPDGLLFALRAGMYQYPNICGCDVALTGSCWVDNDSACLQNQETLNRENYTKEVWVA